MIKGIALSLAGLVLALTRLFGCPSPFAAASLCALNGFECIFLFVGAAAGYVINGGIELCIPYIAAMGIIIIIRLVAGIFLHRERSSFFGIIQSAAAGLCIFAANVFTAAGVYDIFIAASFGVISAVFAFCAGKLRSDGLKTVLNEHKTGVTAALCVIAVLLTAAFTSITVGVINAGVFITSLAVLYSSDLRAEASEAVCAVLLTAGIAAGDPGYAASCIMISVTAPVIMLIGKYGRITRACAFITTIGLGLIITGITPAGGTAALSAVAASVIYMAVPERFSPLSGIKVRTELESNSSPYRAFGKKLENMSAAVDDMKNAVIKTAKALETENIRDISWVYNSASEKVCRKCPSGMKCWGQYYNETADVMNKAVNVLRSGNFVNEDMMTGRLGSECGSKRELAAELNRQYAIYCSAENASHKMTEMRNVLTSQLGATGTMLRRMSEEIGKNDTYDSNAASAAENVLKELGVERPAVIALVIGNKLSIDAYGSGDAAIPPEELADRLSFALRREFDLPTISSSGGRFHITISERARYDVQVKVFRKNKSGMTQSGDSAECFADGKGNVYMLLSDGMGSGSRAKIDSSFSCSMLSKMLKAGIDLDASLEMLNTSLLVKSTDESFATLDLCRIDLNTGDVLTCKAGGSGTYVRCGDIFTAIKEEGLPLGTGFEANYKGKLFRLSEGDVIIMTSDGAKPDEGWLSQLMMRDKHPDLDKIMETLCEALRLSAGKSDDDDMTVIGVKLIR